MRRGKEVEEFGPKGEDRQQGGGEGGAGVPRGWRTLSSGRKGSPYRDGGPRALAWTSFRGDLIPEMLEQQEQWK